MNRDSVNTLLLVTCVGLIAFVAVMMMYRPSIQEIEERLETIISVRHNAHRALEAEKLRDIVRAVLAERQNADPAAAAENGSTVAAPDLNAARQDSPAAADVRQDEKPSATTGDEAKASQAVSENAGVR